MVPVQGKGEKSGSVGRRIEVGRKLEKKEREEGGREGGKDVLKFGTVHLFPRNVWKEGT